MTRIFYNKTGSILKTQDRFLVNHNTLIYAVINTTTLEYKVLDIDNNVLKSEVCCNVRSCKRNIRRYIKSIGVIIYDEIRNRI